MGPHRTVAGVRLPGSSAVGHRRPGSARLPAGLQQTGRGCSGRRIGHPAGGRPATCSCACGGGVGCSWTAPCRAGCCAHPPGRFDPSGGCGFDPSGHPSGRAVTADPGTSAPRVHSALNSCFHFLLRVGDSRFFPTRAWLFALRGERGGGSKPGLQRLWKRSQVVLELRVTCINQPRAAKSLRMQTAAVRHRDWQSHLLCTSHRVFSKA